MGGGSPREYIGQDPRQDTLARTSQTAITAHVAKSSRASSSQEVEPSAEKPLFLKGWCTVFSFADIHPRFRLRESGMDWSHLRKDSGGRS